MVKGFGLDACLAVMNGTCPLWPHIVLRQVHLYVYSKVLSQFTRIILCGRDVKEKICVLWYKLSIHFAQNLLDVKVCHVPCKRVKAADCVCCSDVASPNVLTAMAQCKRKKLRLPPLLWPRRARWRRRQRLNPTLILLKSMRSRALRKWSLPSLWRPQRSLNRSPSLVGLSHAFFPLCFIGV